MSYQNVYEARRRAVEAAQHRHTAAPSGPAATPGRHGKRHATAAEIFEARRQQAEAALKQD